MHSRRGDQLEKAAIDSTTRAENGFESSGAAESIAAAAGRAQATNRLDGEPRAAFGAACGEDLTSADRLHAASKTVVSGAAKLGRLKCAFHGCGLISSANGPGACAGPNEAAWARSRRLPKSLTLERVNGQAVNAGQCRQPFASNHSRAKAQSAMLFGPIAARSYFLVDNPDRRVYNSRGYGR